MANYEVDDDEYRAVLFEVLMSLGVQDDIHRK